MFKQKSNPSVDMNEPAEMRERPVTPPRRMNVASNPPKTKEVSRPTSQTTISVDSTVNGQISGNSDVLISGNFEGSITIPSHTVTIDMGGRAVAKINAAKIVVHGTLVGDLQATELVHIPTTGIVEGDISTSNLILEKGCNFNGSIVMPQKNAEGQKERQNRQSKRTEVTRGPAPRPAARVVN